MDNRETKVDYSTSGFLFSNGFPIENNNKILTKVLDIVNSKISQSELNDMLENSKLIYDSNESYMEPPFNMWGVYDESSRKYTLYINIHHFKDIKKNFMYEYLIYIYDTIKKIYDLLVNDIKENNINYDFIKDNFDITDHKYDYNLINIDDKIKRSIYSGLSVSNNNTDGIDYFLKHMDTEISSELLDEAMTINIKLIKTTISEEFNKIKYLYD